MVSFVARQDEDDDEPVRDSHFFEADQDEPVTRMSLDKDTLQQVHRELGAVLGNLAKLAATSDRVRPPYAARHTFLGNQRVKGLSCESIRDCV